MNGIALITLFLIFWLINQPIVRAGGKYEDIPDILTARQAFRNDILSGIKKSIEGWFYALSGKLFLNTVEGGSMFKVLEKESLVIIDVILKNYPQAGNQTHYSKIKLAPGTIEYE